MKMKRPMNKERFVSSLKKNIFAWALMFIPLLFFLFYVWMPIGRNFLLSFQKSYNNPTFVGFDNYVYIFNDSAFLTAFVNTFKYIGYSILIGFFIPILLGFLLSEVIHFKGAFRVILYLPCMVSGIAVVFLFQNIYGDGSTSLLNAIKGLFGGDSQLWKSDANLVIPLIVIAMTWRGAGSTSLIYLSSFQSIDDSMYEAARIDGATAWQRFLRITIPSLRTTLLTLFVLQIISVFQVFYEPLVIGPDGGPNNASMSLMLLSYLYAFRSTSSGFRYGASAATSVILTLIIIAFTLLYSGLQKLLERSDAPKKKKKKKEVRG